MNISFFFKKPVSTSYSSKINKAIVVTMSHGNKTFLVQNAPQTGGEMVNMWKKAVARLQKEKKSVENCLVLGVAGGDVVRLIKQAFPACEITGVEIDPVMVRLAKKEFGLHTIVPKLIVADAIGWVKRERKEKFDLIIVDLFLGEVNPKATHEQLFLTHIKHLLAPSGVVLYNCDYQEERRSAFGHFFVLCQKHFAKVEVIFRYRKNQLFLLREWVDDTVSLAYNRKTSKDAHSIF